VTAWHPPQLDPRSLVPLYYQLYEALTESIDSGTWPPSGRMASEPELVRAFGVSRIVVRKALAILEDDGHIVRIQGRGTFVAPTKLRREIGGLCRTLAEARQDGAHILILDNRLDAAPPSVGAALKVAASERVCRITSLLTVRSVPVGITYSYFAQAEGARLAAVAHPGRLLPGDLTLADLGLELAFSTADVEISEACKFEADRLGIRLTSTVLVVSCTEFRPDGDAVRPLEWARVIYRGDALRLATQAVPSASRGAVVAS
jgi:GntR family transcriptional regulator